MATMSTYSDGNYFETAIQSQKRELFRKRRCRKIIVVSVISIITAIFSIVTAIVLLVT